MDAYTNYVDLVSSKQLPSPVMQGPGRTAYGEDACIRLFAAKVAQHFSTLFGDYFSLFRQFMEETGSAITGSVLLQIIHNEKYENSDVDFVVPQEGMLKVEKFLKSLELPFEKVLRTTYHAIDNKGFIAQIYEAIFGPAGTKLQFIVTRVSVDNHVNSHDFTIVCNSYQMRDGRDYLKIGDLPSVLNKVIVIHFVQKSLSRRLLKYLSRGFRLSETQFGLSLRANNQTSYSYLGAEGPKNGEYDIKEREMYSEAGCSPLYIEGYKLTPQLSVDA